MLNQLCDPDDRVAHDEHKHRCRCGTCWKHTDDVANATFEDFEEAHKCPSCGREVTKKIMDDDQIVKALVNYFGWEILNECDL
jgi:rRNA maturation endonuclease Nob1